MRRVRRAALLIALGLAASLLFTPVTAGAAPGPATAPEWWFDSWNVPGLWAGGADGRGITVAVVDTGVQADIPELQGKVLPGADFIGNGSDGRTDYDEDNFSHGTAMASIIAASRGFGDIEGVAPSARILPIAVPLKGVIRNGKPTVDATATAIGYAADHGARIISMSLGGIRHSNEDIAPCPTTIQDAVLHALAKGALVVAASGNSGDQGNPVEEPGVCLGVVSVGSVNQQLTASSFSSRHPYLTVTAPGDKIPSLAREFDAAYIGEGTSQATAITSGALAMIWSKFPTESNRQILTRLLSTATDRGPKGRDPTYGLGIINPAAAIAAAAPSSTAANPVFTGVAPLQALAVAQAHQKAFSAARPAGNPTAPLGHIQVGATPSLIGGGFYLPLAGAGLFALLTLVLAIAAIRHRRPRAAR